MTRLARYKRASVRLAQRPRIVLLAARGLQNEEIAEQPGIGRVQVARWRERYLRSGLEDIQRDLPRGAPPVKVDVAKLVELTTQMTPGAGHALEHAQDGRDARCSASGPAPSCAIGRRAGSRRASCAASRSRVTRDGFPVRYWIFPGNTVDVTAVERVKRDLRGWQLSRCVFVGDAGMVSKANLEVKEVTVGDGERSPLPRASTASSSCTATTTR